MPPPPNFQAPENAEQAVIRARQCPEMRDLVEGAFWDEDILAAADRFGASDEWRETFRLLALRPGASVLEIGAGRGMASLAFARAGFGVVALECDPGAVVGQRAIRELSVRAGVRLPVVSALGEALPFADASMDAVYCRAVLHHAADLAAFCREAARVLRPGGVFLAVREHVISRPQDLAAFLAAHPMPALYGGENAFLLREYRAALRSAGLKRIQDIGPYDSPVNYETKYLAAFRKEGLACLPRTLAGPLLALATWPPLLRVLTRYFWSKPGRHFAFLYRKP